MLTYLVEISQEVKSGTGSEVSEVMINSIEYIRVKPDACLCMLYANNSVWLHVLEVKDCLLALLKWKTKIKVCATLLEKSVKFYSSHCSDRLICSLLQPLQHMMTQSIPFIVK